VPGVVVWCAYRCLEPDARRSGRCGASAHVLLAGGWRLIGCQPPPIVQPPLIHARCVAGGCSCPQVRTRSERALTSPQSRLSAADSAVSASGAGHHRETGTYTYTYTYTHAHTHGRTLMPVYSIPSPGTPLCSISLKLCQVGPSRGICPKSVLVITAR
jgi:hypothetical protein